MMVMEMVSERVMISMIKMMMTVMIMMLMIAMIMMLIFNKRLFSSSDIFNKTEKHIELSLKHPYNFCIQEERRRKKEEDELRKKEERAIKRAEYEKLRNPQKANFVINKKADSSHDENVS